MPEPDLATLQRSMWARCIDSTDEGGAPLVVGSPELPAEARLAIYSRAYLGRLIGCLRDEFGLLRAMVGDQVFELFARGYLAACPPRSPSMFDLGAGFAAHLDATRPTDDADDPDGIGSLPAELARVDRAMAEARREAGVEDEPPAPSLDPAALLVQPNLVVRTPSSLRILEAGYALLPVVAAVHRGDPPPMPARAPMLYAVARARYRVGLYGLTRCQHAFLQRCGPTGADFASAAGDAAARSAMSRGAAWLQLATWLPGAVDVGIVLVQGDEPVSFAVNSRGDAELTCRRVRCVLEG